MKITVDSYDESDDDCLRYTYYTVVGGKNYTLAGCALGSYYTYLEVLENARRLFGDDVEVEFCCYISKKPLTSCDP